MMRNDREDVRTVLMLDELDAMDEQTDGSAFYDAHLRRDYPNVQRTETQIVPVSTLGTQVSEAIATGHTRALAHWASTVFKPERATLGSLAALYQAPLNNVGVRKVIAAHAILLSLSGVARLYLRDMLGVAALPTPTLLAAQEALANASSNHKRLLDGITRLVRVRQAHEAFHPQAALEVLTLTDGVWSIVRTATQPDRSPLTLQNGRVVCLTNLSAEEQLISVDWRAVLGTRNSVRDLLTGTRFNVHGPSLALQAYQVMWVTT